MWSSIGADVPLRVYVATTPVSMHKSFEGLSNEVRQVLAADPLSGHVFLFLNRNHTQVKMLLWTRGGFTFPARVSAQAACVEIDAHELSVLLEGLGVATARSAMRWNPMRTVEPARLAA